MIVGGNRLGMEHMVDIGWDRVVIDKRCAFSFVLEGQIG